MLWSVPGIQQMTINIIYYIQWVCTWFTKQWRVNKGFWAEELYISSWNSTVNNLSMKLQFSSVAQSCPTLCNPMDCSTPGFPVHHQLLELAQTHVYRVDDAIQPSHLLSPSSPALSLIQHQSLSQWVSSLHQVAWLELQLGAEVSASVLRVNTQCWFPLGLNSLISLQSKGLSRVFSSITIQKHQFFGAQPSLWSSTHIHIHDYWKNHNFDYIDFCQQSDGSAFKYTVQVCHSSSLKDQVSFNFMAAVAIHSDFGAQGNKACHCFHCFPIYLPWSDGIGCHDLCFLNVEF